MKINETKNGKLHLTFSVFSYQYWVYLKLKTKIAKMPFDVNCIMFINWQSSTSMQTK